MLTILSALPALRMSPPPVRGARRSCAPHMIFDGVKDAFGAGEKPLVGGDRITPFDRWLGLDKEMESEVIERVGTAGVSFVDPNDATSYFTVSLAKPMGIAFVENVGDCQGLVVDEVLPTGSAAASDNALLPGDQLVAVDATLVLGADFDTGLEVRPSHVPSYPPSSYPMHGPESKTVTAGLRARGHDGWAAAAAATAAAAAARGATAIQPHSCTATLHTLLHRRTARKQAIKASSGDTARLVFFRGPTNFLYGPTKPDDEWYRSNLL